MLMPEEVAFFAPLGFGEILLMAFGVAQTLGGGLMVARKTRKLGATIAATMFALSATMILFDGQTLFGLVSRLPLVITGCIARRPNPSA